MKIIARGIICFLVMGLLTISPSGSSDTPLSEGPPDSLVIPVQTRSGVTAYLTLGIPSQPPFVMERTLAGATIYSNGIHRIELSESGGASGNVIRIRAMRGDGQAFALGDFSILAHAPQNAIAGIWYPSAEVRANDVMAADATESIRGVTDANYGIPYIAAADANSNNVIALGLGRQDASVRISGRPVQNGFYEFQLAARTGRSAKVFDERFYLSTNPAFTWFDAASNYADWVDTISNYRPFPVSERAYAPVYDTWYWSADRVDQSLYLETAKLASDLGAGMYLADAGWDAPTGEYAKWLSGRTGDYTPPPDKFPNLSATFDAIRAYGDMGVQLWLQPFAVGRASHRYPLTRDLHIHLPNGHERISAWLGLDYAPYALPSGAGLETVNLCPRVPQTQNYLRNLFNEMAAQYHPEGYWLDFMDGLSSVCAAPHSHSAATFGDGFRQQLNTIKQTILANNPQAVVHFRAPYANLNNKTFSNVWQSEDSPESFDRMRLNALRLRPFSKGVVFASDQLYWKETESEANASRFVMTSVMTGVPSFGPNLIKAPQWTSTMLRAWLGFYEANRQELTQGRIVPFGSLRLPNHRIEGESNTFVYLRNLVSNEVVAATKNIYLMNATESDRINLRVRPPLDTPIYSATVLNRYLVPSRRPIRVYLSRNGVLNLNLAVEQGGVVHLTPLTLTTP